MMNSGGIPVELSHSGLIPADSGNSGLIPVDSGLIPADSGAIPPESAGITRFRTESVGHQKVQLSGAVSLLFHYFPGLFHCCLVVFYCCLAVFHCLSKAYFISHRQLIMGKFYPKRKL